MKAVLPQQRPSAARLPSLRTRSEALFARSVRASRLTTWLAVGGTSICLATALVLLRGRPSVQEDAGIFLSVAARLLAGDRLYAGVWDNKDPLFYYTYAGALAVGGWRAPFLLDIVWLAFAAVGTALLLRALGASWLTTAVGLFAYPLLLTGSYYYAGYSMLPALALAPGVAWLWARGRFAWCGALLGVGLLYKSNLALVLASGPVALAYASLPVQGRRRPAARTAGGLAVALLIGALVLAVRGELVPYWNTLVDNISYSDNVLAAIGRPTGIYGHLRVLAVITHHPVLLAELFSVGVVIAILILVRARGLQQPRRRDALAPLAALLVGSSATTLITLAATAVWLHHAQMLAWPGLFLVALSAHGLERTISSRWRQLAATLVAVGVPLWALGAFSEAPGVALGQSWTSAGHSAAADALDRVRAERLRGRRSVRYAVLGTNHEQAHAAFFHGDWDLVCPRFQQYPFSPRLDEVVRCIQQRRPTLLLLTYSFPPQPHARTRWDRFVGEVASLLKTSYERVQEVGGFAVWELRRAPGSGG